MHPCCAKVAVLTTGLSLHGALKSAPPSVPSFEMQMLGSSFELVQIKLVSKKRAVGQNPDSSRDAVGRLDAALRRGIGERPVGARRVHLVRGALWIE